MKLKFKSRNGGRCRDDEHDGRTRDGRRREIGVGNPRAEGGFSAFNRAAGLHKVDSWTLLFVWVPWARRTCLVPFLPVTWRVWPGELIFARPAAAILGRRMCFAFWAALPERSCCWRTPSRDCSRWRITWVALDAPGRAAHFDPMLFEVKPTDAFTFVSISLLLGAVALAAGYLPARRAMALKPAAALRHE